MVAVMFVIVGQWRTTTCNSPDARRQLINCLPRSEGGWPQQTQDIADQFYAKGLFPCVCGIIDGTMVNIDAPAEVRASMSLFCVVVLRKRPSIDVATTPHNHLWT